MWTPECLSLQNRVHLPSAPRPFLSHFLPRKGPSARQAAVTQAGTGQTATRWDPLSLRRGRRPSRPQGLTQEPVVPSRTGGAGPVRANAAPRDGDGPPYCGHVCPPHTHSLPPRTEQPSAPASPVPGRRIPSGPFLSLSLNPTVPRPRGWAESHRPPSRRHFLHGGSSQEPAQGGGGEVEGGGGVARRRSSGGERGTSAFARGGGGTGRASVQPPVPHRGCPAAFPARPAAPPYPVRPALTRKNPASILPPPPPPGRNALPSRRAPRARKAPSHARRAEGGREEGREGGRGGEGGAEPVAPQRLSGAC